MEGRLQNPLKAVRSSGAHTLSALQVWPSRGSSSCPGSQRVAGAHPLLAHTFFMHCSYLAGTKPCNMLASTLYASHNSS